MFSLDTFFITLTLLVLSVILIKIRARNVIIPLGIIYVLFIINKLSNVNSENHLKEEVSNDQLNLIQPKSNFALDKSSKKKQIQKPVNKDIRKDQKEIEDPKILDKESIDKKAKEKKVNKKNSQPKIKKVEPKKVSKEIKEKQNFYNLLTLKEIKVCKNIKNRNPVGIGEVFPNSVDSLYCFTKIENLGKKMEVRHVWYYENQIMTQVRYNVKKSNVYRSWTKKTISSFQIGNWRVEVQDRNGTIIGTKRFKIKKSS